MLSGDPLVEGIVEEKVMEGKHNAGNSNIRKWYNYWRQVNVIRR